jgi:hypothetical protein
LADINHGKEIEMEHPHHKTADDQLVTDGAAAMRKTILATRRVMSVPKAKVDAMMAKRKGREGKQK